MQLVGKRIGVNIIGGGCLLVLLAGGVTGCGGAGGPDRGAVTGTVSFEGKPIDQGSILFVPVAGKAGSSSGAAITDGKFQIPKEKGPVVGMNRVEVHWPRKTGRKKEVGSPAPPGTMIDEVEEAIPATFNTKSTLEQRIERGNNPVDLKLTASGAAAK